MNRTVVGVMLICMGVGFIGLMLGVIVGTNADKERLYIKCLTANSEMPYNKAVAFCKEQVK